MRCVYTSRNACSKRNLTFSHPIIHGLTYALSLLSFRMRALCTHHNSDSWSSVGCIIRTNLFNTLRIFISWLHAIFFISSTFCILKIHLFYFLHPKNGIIQLLNPDRNRRFNSHVSVTSLATTNFRDFCIRPLQRQQAWRSWHSGVLHLFCDASAEIKFSSACWAQ